MEKPVKELKMEGTVDTCPVCDYTNGFHVSFVVGKEHTEIILICPNCSSRFKPNWFVKESESCL